MQKRSFYGSGVVSFALKCFLQRIVYPKPWDPKCTKRRVGVCFEESLRKTDISVFKMQTDRAMLVILSILCSSSTGADEGCISRACVNGHVAAAKSSSEGPSRPTIASTFITSNLFRQRCQCWVTNIRWVNFSEVSSFWVERWRHTDDIIGCYFQ